MPGRSLKSVESFDLWHLFGAYCSARTQWGLLIHYEPFSRADQKRQAYVSGSYTGDLALAAPCLADQDLLQATVDGWAFFVGDRSHIEALYNQTVGDDGAADNDYLGPVRVYALIYGPDGRMRNDNT